MSDAATPTTAAPPKPQHHAAQWGLAACLIGVMQILFFPIMLTAFAVAGGLLMDHSPERWVEAVPITLIVGWITIITMCSIGLFGLLCAVIGVISGLARRQPLGLAVAALPLTLVGLILTVALSGVALTIAEEMKKERTRVEQLRKKPAVPNVFDFIPFPK
jgi:uncharacterized membrane protein